MDNDNDEILLEPIYTKVGWQVRSYGGGQGGVTKE